MGPTAEEEEEEEEEANAKNLMDLRPHIASRGHQCTVSCTNRGILLIRNTPPVVPYSSRMPRVLGWTYGGLALPYERGTPIAF